MLPFLVRDTQETYEGIQPVPRELFLEGNPTAEVWRAADIPNAENAKVGIWVGQPGAINVPAYPSDEVFTVLSGRIELESTGGQVLQVGPGDSCVLRKGWAGTWRTLETTRKCFVIFGAA